ncbi:MAG: transcription/translation regulatory transformer protein RfaH [Gammaproteobacteria bacterium]|nr:transcription/translation regulatory transformer protein RfaH [Gammaproteobacteria bacterium]
MKSWYLIYTKSRQEQIASQHLSAQGYRVFVPFLSLKKRTAQGWRLVQEPLFPNYLFIQLDESVDSFKPIRSTRGVSCFVRFGEQVPAIIPLPVIEQLLALDLAMISELRSQIPKIGEEVLVHIADASVKALVMAIDAPSRVQVLFQLLGQETQSWVDIQQVVC